MSRLPDPLRSKAVLIGCADYQAPELPPIPAVKNNLHDLSAVLTDLGGFPECVVIADPAQTRQVVSQLRQTAKDASDVLLVYYAGHGLIDSRGELYLGLTDTVQDELAATALPFAIVRDALRDSPAYIRIVILDCCYSGRVIDSMSSASPNLAALSEIAGTFTLASSSATAIALARPGEPYTAFTGELIRLLSQGIPGAAEVLTIQAIADAVRNTMITLGYPRPQIRSTDNAWQIGLVRNRAFDPAVEVIPEQQAPPPTRLQDGEMPAELPTNEGGQRSEEDLEWSNDAPSDVDLLRRAPIAAVLALRLIETHTMEPETSFLMHLDGPWGSGKSTVLNLLEDRIDDYFRVARFDAWRHSRLAPAWWSLLTALRLEVSRTRPWWRRPFLRIRESAARVRRTGAPYVIAFVIVAIAAIALGYLIWPKNPAHLDWQGLAKAVAAVLATLGTMTAGALAAARLLLWDSVRGARLFEQTQANPMADILAHFRWLLRRSDKPVAFFIDDLDRCDENYVVEFLDMIQTLVRSMGGLTKRSERAAYFVIAADGTWLRRSYEAAHASFVDCMTEPGSSLGYLFLDKIFQLTLPMPGLTPAARSSYLDDLLGIRERSTATEGVLRETQSAQRVDGGLMDRLRQFEEGRAQSVVAALASAAERKRTEHALRKFSAVLGDNPRTAKKFLNTYSILRSIRFLEDIHVDPDALALWSLIAVRWPNIAHHLTACPDAVAGIIDPLWCSEHFPEPLLKAATSAELRAVVTSTDGGPLTPGLIRQCCGTQLSGLTGFPEAHR